MVAVRRAGGLGKIPRAASPGFSGHAIELETVPDELRWICPERHLSLSNYRPAHFGCVDLNRSSLRTLEPFLLLLLHGRDEGLAPDTRPNGPARRLRAC